MGKISWLGEHGLTLNPGIYGCSPAGAACDHCYAERMARRLVTMHGSYRWAQQADTGPIVGPDGWTGRVVVDPVEEAIARIRRVPSLQGGGRRKVFVTSMGDILHESISPQWLSYVLQAMSCREDIDWLLLTKRGERWPDVSKFLSEWPSNMWPGVTIWDQESADRLIPPLLQVPARVRWVSAEPLLGPVDLDLGPSPELEPWVYCESQECGGWSEDGVNQDCETNPCESWKRWRDRPRVSWLIVGGENGPGARPMHPDWVRSLRDQAVSAGVPFHFKGWGRWVPASNTVGHQDRHLDGRTWDETP